MSSSEIPVPPLPPFFKFRPILFSKGHLNPPPNPPPGPPGPNFQFFRFLLSIFLDFPFLCTFPFFRSSVPLIVCLVHFIFPDFLVFLLKSFPLFKWFPLFRAFRYPASFSAFPFSPRRVPFFFFLFFLNDLAAPSFSPPRFFFDFFFCFFTFSAQGPYPLFLPPRRHPPAF